MDVEGFLRDLKAELGYRDQIVHIREEEARAARFADPERPLTAAQQATLAARGIDRLWTHQAKALDLFRRGQDVLLTTGPASGKTLCYLLPILEAGRALILSPTKALSRDQARVFPDAGVYDGDTPPDLRRRHRDRAEVLLTNPDTLHAAILPQHARWSRFLAGLRVLVIDELHVYAGILGSNAAHLFRRLFRVCRHHGSAPRVIACSATIRNPSELAEELTGRPFTEVADDGSPRGRRTFVLWNPPRVRKSRRRSRRSANAEAQSVFTALVRRGVRTIVFSKARITAELIHRYAVETLSRDSPGLARRVSAYRSGLLRDERREIERRLFSGELLGVSATNALELGIDVGSLDACVITGYPGTLASFFQQAGRAGRREEDSLVVMVGLDTPTNQYVLRRPEYLFGRPVERAVIDPENPFVLLGHLRCATQELPVATAEARGFGRQADLVLSVLEENGKVRRIGDRWFHAASEVPQHSVSLRDVTDRNVVIEDADSGEVIGEVSKFDAPTVLHEGAIHLQHGEPWRVLRLDLSKSVATAKRVRVDYYTQSKGYDDVHHVDHVIREKPFGTGTAYFGEVTVHMEITAYEKIRFWELDAVSRHPLDLPIYPIETMAFWIVPPLDLMREMTRDGLEPVSGLRGIGYAVRMVMPLYMCCETPDLSHTIGSVDTPWQTVFLWEHYPRGLGFTAKGFELLHEILPAVRESIASCDCGDGCPLCVGKPLRDYAVLNPERGEGAIPSKAAALRILEGLLGDGTALDLPERETLTDRGEAREVRLAAALSRRLMEKPFAPAPQPERGKAFAKKLRALRSARP